MIINKNDKSYQTIVGVNYNYGGDDFYYVEDYSPLAQKVEQYFPRFDFVLDEAGELIDIIEIPKTEEEIKQEQIEKIDEELKQIDNEGVNRHLENQIEATNTYDTIYESTRKLIDRKNELREQRKKLKGEQTEV